MTLEQQQTYMQTAKLFAKLSKAERLKVGAVLVTVQGLMIPGVNGTPSGTSNSCEVLKGDCTEWVTKPEVIHAELNSLLKAAKEGVSVLDSTIFITHSPCLQCAAMLKQAGVKKVYYQDTYRDNSGVEYLIDNGIEVERIQYVRS